MYWGNQAPMLPAMLLPSSSRTVITKPPSGCSSIRNSPGRPPSSMISERACSASFRVRNWRAADKGMDLPARGDCLGETWSKEPPCRTKVGSVRPIPEPELCTSSIRLSLPKSNRLPGFRCVLTASRRFELTHAPAIPAISGGEGAPARGKAWPVGSPAAEEGGGSGAG